MEEDEKEEEQRKTRRRRKRRKRQRRSRRRGRRERRGGSSHPEGLVAARVGLLLVEGDGLLVDIHQLVALQH